MFFVKSTSSSQKVRKQEKVLIVQKEHVWRILKQPARKSLGPHISVLQCNCWTYDENISLKLKYQSFAIWGV